MRLSTPTPTPKNGDYAALLKTLCINPFSAWAPKAVSKLEFAPGAAGSAAVPAAKSGETPNAAYFLLRVPKEPDKYA
jgi:hypothetical protein